METATTITHGNITIEPAVHEAFVVRVNDNGTPRRIGRFDDRDDARAAANAAFKLDRANFDAADIVARHITRLATEYSGGHSPISFDECLSMAINDNLGYCADGCCGGPECMLDEEIPAFLAWERRVRRAVNGQACV